MGFIKGVKKQDYLNSYVLKQVTLLAESIEPWRDELLDDYEEGRDGSFTNVDQISTSLLNAALTQQRIVFLISRNSLRALINSDKNHTKKPTFGNDTYPLVIKEVCNGGLLKELVKGEGNKAGVYEVILPDVLKFLPDSADAQRKQVIDAQSKFGHQDGRQMDERSDTENDSEGDFEEDTKNNIGNKTELEPDTEEGSKNEEVGDAGSLHTDSPTQDKPTLPGPPADALGPGERPEDDSGFQKIDLDLRRLHESYEDFLRRKGHSEREIELILEKEEMKKKMSELEKKVENISSYDSVSIWDRK